MTEPIESVPLASAWLRFYTRGLPPEIRQSRLEEIASDIYEQRSTYPDVSSAHIAARMMRGARSDLTWRNEELTIMKQQQPKESFFGNAWAVISQAWFTPIAALIGLFNVVMAVGVFLQPEGTAPGNVIGPIIMLGLAFGLFAGLRLRYRVTVAFRAPGFSAEGTAPSQLGQTLAVVGLAVLSVFLLAVGVVGSFFALGTGLAGLGLVAFLLFRGRRPENPALGSEQATGNQLTLSTVLIVAGTLPSLAIFWLIIPALASIAVIIGLIVTRPRAAHPVVSR